MDRIEHDGAEPLQTCSGERGGYPPVRVKLVVLSSGQKLVLCN